MKFLTNGCLGIMMGGMTDYRLVIRWSMEWKKRLDKYAKLAKRKTSSYARYVLEEHLENLEKETRKKKNSPEFQ